MRLSIINVSYENEILHEGYGKQLGVAPGVPTMKGAYGDPENTKRGYNSIIDTLGNHDVPQGWIQTPRPNTTPNTNPGPPVSWNDPSNPDDPQAGYGYIPNDTTKEETFFYHSDHLGSTSYNSTVASRHPPCYPVSIFGQGPPLDNTHETMACWFAGCCPDASFCHRQICPCPLSAAAIGSLL